MKRPWAGCIGDPRILESERVEQSSHNLVADPEHQLVVIGAQRLFPVQVLDRQRPRGELDVRRYAANIHNAEVRGNGIVADRPPVKHAEDEGPLLVPAPVEHRPLGQESPPIAHGALVRGIRQNIGSPLTEDLIAEPEFQTDLVVDPVFPVKPGLGNTDLEDRSGLRHKIINDSVRIERIGSA